MDIEVRKKLIVPFLVFIAILGVNANSIINGINQHNSARVVIACVSTLIVFALFFIVIRNTRRNSK